MRVEVLVPSLVVAVALGTPAIAQEDPTLTVAYDGVDTNPCFTRATAKKALGRGLLTVMVGDAPPDKVTETIVDGLTVTTSVWTRPLTEDELEFAEPHEDQYVFAWAVSRDQSGTIRSEVAGNNLHHSDSMTVEYTHSDEGILVDATVTGPGNSQTDLTFSYDAEGLVRETERVWWGGAYWATIVRSLLVREGERVVRILETKFESENDVVSPVDEWKNTTFEYDAAGDFIKRYVVERDYQGFTLSSVTPASDCK